MDQTNPYFNQVQLLINVLPTIAEHPVFALKGGTAINLFIRELPRLSVDIDLTYEPVKNREESLADIHANLIEIKQKLESKGLQVIVNDAENASRLFVSNQQARIKIETSPVLRGTIHPVIMLGVQAKVEDLFGYAEIQVLNFDDLYAGKLCAAMDRQHPRDLFDVMFLLENEGITETLKNTFLVYLISHSRPISELLAPRRVEIKEIYEKEFASMTHQPVTLAALEEARENLILQIGRVLNSQDKKFLLDLKSGHPNWEEFYYPEAEHLPAVLWKCHNLQNMSAQKRKSALVKLENVLEKL